MAQRRMFSLKIIDTDLFLDMPASTQLLYFHLSIRADDDGFVASPKRTQKMIGSSDDDLKLLIAKQFIIPFDSGVCVIKHWRVHNYIQKDRYTPTFYNYEKSLLTDDGGVYEISMDTECIQNVSKMCPQDRLGKDRLEEGKDRLELEKNPCQLYADEYNAICHSMPKCIKMTAKRRKAINTVKKTFSDKEIKQAFLSAEASDFLTNRNGKGFTAGFDWIMNVSNMTKILEGNYKNKSGKSSGGNKTFLEMYQEQKESGGNASEVKIDL